MIDERKNPDQLLHLISKQEQRNTEGSLSIFLGMAAGVGKTYAMLQMAHKLKREGVDVVVGLVETHRRKETEALLEGLEILPRQAIQHRGITIEELDLDAILRRKPRVVLIDELAHTNAEGVRHKKRYLDVLEVLRAGIDVLTTLNVQHIESRTDTVRDITSVPVHETIPDKVLDRADDIRLVDLPPEELLKRLAEGKIYGGEHAKIAGDNFFKKANLSALREMALRVAAEHVDRDLREYRTLHGIEGVWKSSGRLMVAIFASPYSEVLIRWTRRVADLLNVTWIGAYIEQDDSRSAEEKALLAKNIALVKQIGGEVISTKDTDIVRGLLRVAHQNNVTQIIVGKSRRTFLKRLLSGGSLVNRLLRQSGSIDVYAVSTGRTRERRLFKQAWKLKASSFTASDAGWLTAITLGTWLLAEALQPVLGYMAVGILFLIAVSIAGLFLSRIAIFCMALAFACIHNFLFIPPRFTLVIEEPEDIMLLSMFFVAAAVIGSLTTRLKQKERALRSREEQTMHLYRLAKDLSDASTMEIIIARSEDHLESVLNADVDILLADSDSKVFSYTSARILASLSSKEQAVAQWVLENEKPAGKGTDTLNAASATYLPLASSSRVIGVVAIKLKDELPVPQIEEGNVVEGFLHQIASAIEREQYRSRMQSLLIVEETEKLYKSLLDCVSHELKTPLAAIKGSASALIDPLTSSNQTSVESLGGEILTASDRLQRLVDNLLDMTRIESGMMKPKQELCDVSDLFATALGSLERKIQNHPISINVSEDTPAVLADPVLINQALSNLIHNACNHTRPQTPIELSASYDAKHVKLYVRDFGQGLPKEHPEIVLEKFYRADQNHAGGIGLGLSIAKGFVESQGGVLEAHNHTGGGAEFVLSLPRGQNT